ncbi:MAG: hypothetical protein P8P44_00605 [Alphaproteobacteria bacterium]|nr:hypothetical protein [Alphaproteobacteria bacterium]
MAHDGLRWKVALMIWSFFFDIVVAIQAGSVVFGTLLAAPLVSSLSETRRRRGFICMAVGSLLAFIATSSAGLWVLAAANAFWVVSSLRGYWLLSEQPLGAVTEGIQATTPEALQNALDDVSEAMVETGQAVLETVNLDNRPPDAV